MKALYRISNSGFTAILKLLVDEALPENNTLPKSYSLWFGKRRRFGQDLSQTLGI
jgi:hypothetical protein